MKKVTLPFLFLGMSLTSVCVHRVDAPKIDYTLEGPRVTICGQRELYKFFSMIEQGKTQEASQSARRYSEEAEWVVTMCCNGEHAAEDDKIKKLPPQIGTLKRLGDLQLYNNELTSIAPEIGELTELEWLYLDGNLLESIPQQIGLLKKLKWLSVRGGLLKTLPSEIAELVSLKWLQLEGNQFTGFPPIVRLIPKLRYFSFRENPVSNLEEVEEFRKKLVGTDKEKI